MNKVHYIYKYKKLKYGLFIHSLLTAMHYESFWGTTYFCMYGLSISR